MTRILACALALIALAGSLPASALPVITNTSFDVATVSNLDVNGATATGTSNGVGWTLGPTHFSSCCGHSIVQGYTGFNTGNFVTPLTNTDALHITQADFTITFDQAITEIVFYARENGGTANFDFGMTPTLLSGASNITQLSGTRYRVNTSGGAFGFSGLNTTTLTHSSSVFDGMNMAFFVSTTAVPAPAGWVLLMPIAALIARRVRGAARRGESRA